MQTDIRQQLSKALEAVSDQYAEVAADPASEIGVYPATFLNQYRIYLVERFSPRRHVFFYVGFAPDKDIYLLTNLPENFAGLARADMVSIQSAQMAVDYVKAYLEVTRPARKLFYLVASADEVRFRPNLDEKEQAEKASFVEQYRPVVSPPSAMPTNGRYTVTLYAVREQAFERHVVQVGLRGELTSEITVLVQDLPLLYGT